MNFVEENNSNNIKPLYENCDYIYNDDDRMYIYVPKNELDIDLFNLLINSELLKNENIDIYTEMDGIPFAFPYYSLGDLYFGAVNNYCNECKLVLPFDLHFYSNKSCEEIANEIYNTNKLEDKYNLCKECYKIHKDENLNLVMVSTGLDNISDWIHIFTVKKKYVGNSGSQGVLYYDYYCNLNKNSPHYKKFAVQYYEGVVGEDILIKINETSLEEILCKYEWLNK